MNPFEYWFVTHHLNFVCQLLLVLSLGNDICLIIDLLIQCYIAKRVFAGRVVTTPESALAQSKFTSYLIFSFFNTFKQELLNQIPVLASLGFCFLNCLSLLVDSVEACYLTDKDKLANDLVQQPGLINLLFLSYHGNTLTTIG